MLQSSHCKHVYWFPDGSLIEGQTYDEGWYFFDEVGLVSSSAFETELEAIEQFEKYATWLNKVEYAK
jgi:hypothetical protein